jgi:S1-C subfamily serine protease
MQLLRNTIYVIILVFKVSIAQDLSVLFEQVESSVVVIHTKQSDIDSENWKQIISTEGLGSGVLISNTQVLTAAHVVHVADDILVQFKDGQLIHAVVVASSSYADVALLELNEIPNNPQPCPIGDSDKAKIGEKVFVIGAPYGLSYSLTSGHISGRIEPNKITDGFAGMEFIQTDAAINEGNSGGPMFNMNGEVIGIVSHIITISGGFEGLGFAATSNFATKILLREKTFWTGTESYLITAPVTNVLNVPQTAGLLIQKVAKGSLGDRLGIQAGYLQVEIDGNSLLLGGDTVLEINGIIIEDATSIEKIRSKVMALNPGELFSVTIWRRGKRLVIEHQL